MERDQPISRLTALSVEPLFRNNPTILLLTVPETGVVLDANLAAEKFFGYSRHEFQSKNISEIRARLPQEAQIIPEPAVLVKPDPARPYRLADGAIRLMEEYILPGSTAEGTCFFIALLDVTERREMERALLRNEETARQQVEEALRLSEEKFSQAFKISPDSININRLSDGVYLDINDGFTALTGYTREDVLGRSSLPGDLGIWVNLGDREHLVSRLKTHGEVIGLEAPFRRKNGTVLYGSMSARILNINGEQCILSITRDLTQRIYQEEVLRERERNYREIFNATSDGMIIFNESTEIVDANEKACAFFGIDYSALLAYPAHDFFQEFSPVAPVGVEEHLLRALTNGPQTFPWQARNRSGEPFWVEVALKACEINGQKRLIASLRDLTGRKKEEELRRTYGEVQQALIDNFPFLVWLKDEESRFLAVNKPFAQACGLGAPEAVVGKTDLDIWPAELARSYRADDRTVLASGQPKNVEEMIEQSGKPGAWFETFKSPVRVKDRIVGTVGFSRDITERKEAEDILAAEHERLLVTLASIGDGVIATDTQGKIIIMNKVAERLTGWAQLEAQGRNLSEVFVIANENSKVSCGNPIDKVLADKTTVELASHTLLISKNGGEYIIGDSGAPILDGQGGIIGVVLVFRDMTEKQRLLDATQRTQKLESLSVLAGGIAHDFNNLLGGIFGYLDLAKNASRDPKVSEYVDAALSAMDRARALTYQLLTFAKGGAPVRKVLPLGPFLKETANFALSGSNVSCQWEVAPDLCAVEFDKNQLGQVVDNILINAQQAMPAGGKVKISARNITLQKQEHVSLPPGEYIRVTFEDNGAGIPRDILSRIFDPFFTTKPKGSGLGLATCYSIMSRHNGSIEVESEPGQGSTFHLYLPVYCGSAVPGPKAARKFGTRQGKILLMDDEKIIRSLVSDMLLSLGHTCVSTATGEEAIRQFQQAERAGQPFDAVILDLTVPGGMGGKEAAALIRERNSTVPLIVSSGYAEDPVVANPPQYGFSGSLRKPFVMSELAELLNDFLA